MGEYHRATSIDEATDQLARRRLTVVAGCTDYYCLADARPFADDVLDVSGIAEARGIVDAGEHFRIGALTTWSDILRMPWPTQFDALRDAARQVGGVQIQNAGTVGGNLCNASPAADGVPPLLILDAEVEVRSASGARLLPLGAFIVGNRQTARRPDELLTSLLVRKRSGRHASRFAKLGARAYQVISIVMVAALLEADERGRVAAVAVAVGACSEVAQRLPSLEAALLGRPLQGRRLSSALEPHHLAPLAPIDDVRAAAAYRLDAARTLIGRTLDDLQERLR